jgi:hypothetical protein
MGLDPKSSLQGEKEWVSFEKEWGEVGGGSCLVDGKLKCGRGGRFFEKVDDPLA